MNIRLKILITLICGFSLFQSYNAYQISKRVNEYQNKFQSLRSEIMEKTTEIEVYKLLLDVHKNLKE